MPITIGVGNVKGRVIAPPDLIDALRAHFRYRPEGYSFMSAYKNGVWDGWRVLISQQGAFAAGLFEDIERFIRERGYDVNYDDRRTEIRHGKVVDELPGIELREYQREAIWTAVGRRRGIIKLPTGTGKTEIIAGICATFSDAGCTILTHMKSLRSQSAIRLNRRLDETVGMIGGGIVAPQRVTVAMVQTCDSMNKRGDEVLERLIAGTQVLILDEVHHTRSDSWQTIASLFVHACVRIGVSATPFTNEGERCILTGHTGAVIYERSVTEMSDAGFLATARVLSYPAPPPSTYGGETYESQYHNGIETNVQRNRLIAALAVRAAGEGEYVLVLVNRIEQGREIERLCNTIKSGCAQFVFGATNDEERATAERAFKHHTKVLIASRIFGEGKDLPEITMLINASGGKSERELIQKAGRALRVLPDKRSATIIDFRDQPHHLARHSRARFRAYEKLGFEIIQRTV